MSAPLEKLYRALIRINHLALDSSGLDDEVAESVTRELLDACEADSCTLIFPSPQAHFQSLVIDASSLVDRNRGPLPCPTRISQNAAREALVCTDQDRCMCCEMPPDGASLCIPLGIDSNPLGVLRLWRSRAEAFTESEIEVALSVGLRLSAAIRRSQLLDELQKANEQLEARVERRTRELAVVNAELLRQKEAAEAANEAKSQFLANMSHEIRTPMNGIMGMAEILLDTPLQPEQRGYVESLMRCAESLLDVLNDVLDLSKIEAGHVSLQQVPYNPRKVVEDVGAVLGTRAAERGLELVCLVSPTMPRQVIGDATRLRQILTNLATNAIKFTRRGEVVLLGGSEPEPGGTVSLWFEVQDSGIGIPEDKIPHLFEKFTQLDGSISRRYGGTGLGLAICKQLVELMGGSIEVESCVGVGSTFRVRFSAPLAPSVAEQSPPEPSFGGRRVLLIDDHASSRAAVAALLTQMGCQVQLASSGKSALDRWTATDLYDAVIIDASMGDLDGYETCIGIRAQPRGAEVPIIMMTAGARRRDRARAKDLGIMGFVQKPVRRDAVVGALARAFSQNPRPDEHSSVHRNGRSASSQGTRVLLVEDNATNLEFLTVLLQRAGFEVYPVESGEAALELLRKRPVDVVLMDVQMPRMDGYATTREIRSDRSITDVPIIAVTAHAMRGDEERCLQAGMDAYVSKPVDPATLFETIEQCLRDRRSASARPTATPVTVKADTLRSVQPIDLDKLADDTGWEFAVKHVARYLERAQAALVEAEQALGARNADAVGKLAHQIRGGAIHMPRVVEAATEVMRLAREENWASLQEALTQLGAALGEARTYYEQRVKASRTN